MRRLLALGFLGSFFSPLVAQAESPTSRSSCLVQDTAPTSRCEDRDRQQTQANGTAENSSEILRSFQSYAVDSKTVFMHADVLQRALEDRPEFKRWKLAPRSPSQKADVSIEISLPPLSWEWNYRLFESASGNLLAAGKVRALEEHVASKLLAAEIAKQIEAVRGIPEESVDDASSVTSQTASEQQWRVKGGSGSFRNQEINLSIGPDLIIVTEVNNDDHTIRVPTQSITAIYRINLGPPSFWDRMQAGAGEECCESGPLADLKAQGIDLVQAGEMLVGPVLAVPFLTVVGIDSIRVGLSTRHLVAIRWERENATYALAFESGEMILNGLFRDLKNVAPEGATFPPTSMLPLWSDTPPRAADIPWGNALQISLDQAVTASFGPWPPLEPGVYQLEIIERKNAPAQINFYRRELSQFLDLRAVAFAHLQRGLPTVASPVMTLREKDGTRMLDEIRVATILLHFD
jgi:hypothetical protein